MLKSIKTGVLASLLLASAVVAHAQKKQTEGTITYAAQYFPTDEQKAAVSMLPKENKIKFNGDFIKLNIENGPAMITIIQDLKKHEGLTLIDVPIAQMQFAVKTGKAEYDQQMALSPKFADFKATGEKKQIGAYQAERYTYADDKGNSYELWTTQDLHLPENFFSETFKDVKGTLLVYTTFQQGLKTTFTFKSIAEDKVGALSLEVPSGYELKTMQEIMSMQGGGE